MGLQYFTDYRLLERAEIAEFCKNKIEDVKQFYLCRIILFQIIEWLDFMQLNRECYVEITNDIVLILITQALDVHNCRVVVYGAAPESTAWMHFFGS